MYFMLVRFRMGRKERNVEVREEGVRNLGTKSSSWDFVELREGLGTKTSPALRVLPRRGGGLVPRMVETREERGLDRTFGSEALSFRVFLRLKDVSMDREVTARALKSLGVKLGSAPLVIKFRWRSLAASSPLVYIRSRSPAFLGSELVVKMLIIEAPPLVTEVSSSARETPSSLSSTMSPVLDLFVFSSSGLARTSNTLFSTSFRDFLIHFRAFAIHSSSGRMMMNHITMRPIVKDAAMAQKTARSRTISLLVSSSSNHSKNGVSKIACKVVS